MVDVGTRCCGCGACFYSCPQKCIKIVNNKDGFPVSLVDVDSCVQCGRCEKVCPVLIDIPTSAIPEVFLAASKNTKERNVSSSGGIFALLAKQIIDQGGVVCGAVIEPYTMKVQHTIIDSTEDLPQLLGSKYVQSDLGNCLPKIRDLAKERLVLFCGTPCQVSALRQFVGESKNVVGIDFICHGVPSNKVFQNYIKSMERRYKSKIDNVNFRCKDTTWKKFSMYLHFENGSSYRKNFDLDPYGQAFTTNISLRESCYSCPSRQVSRQSDITLSDAWGVSNSHTLIKENLGASTVFIHSVPGQVLFDTIKDQISTETLSDNEKKTQLMRLTEGHDKHRNYRDFFNNLGQIDFCDLVKQYARYSLMKRIRKYVKLLVK